MLTARDLALIDLLARGYVPPSPDAVNYEAKMQIWQERYRNGVTSARRLIAAAHQFEEREKEVSTDEQC